MRPLFISMKRLTEYFLPHLIGADDKNRQRWSLLIKFLLISIGFAIGYFVNTYFTGFIMARYTMVGCSVLFGIQLMLIRNRFIGLHVASHVYVCTCWVVIFLLTLSSGGIRSFVLAWVTLVPIIALLLLSARAAWYWGGVGAATVLFFSFSPSWIQLPPHLIMTQNDLLIASLVVGLQFLLLTLTYIFDQQQHVLIETIEASREELTKTKAEVTAQNETLVQSQKEITFSRDLVALQNRRLRDAQAIIARQNEELMEKNEHLEQEISKRTQSLVEYNQQLEQFAFLSSHNLRAPIARILGLGNLMSVSKTSADDEFIKKNMVQSAVELDRIMKDISLILDVKKGTQAIYADVDVRQELDAVIAHLQPDLNETRTVVSKQVDVDKPFRTIRPYFTSILYNLLSNAIKYRKLNEIATIDVQIKRESNRVCIVVRDNGIGIDLKANNGKLFGLYQRMHTHVEGKGIGLYLVKTQAEVLGGTAEVESEVGVGTTFRVWLKG